MPLVLYQGLSGRVLSDYHTILYHTAWNDALVVLSCFRYDTAKLSSLTFWIIIFLVLFRFWCKTEVLVWYVHTHGSPRHSGARVLDKINAKCGPLLSIVRSSYKANGGIVQSLRPSVCLCVGLCVCVSVRVNFGVIRYPYYSYRWISLKGYPISLNIQRWALPDERYAVTRTRP